MSEKNIQNEAFIAVGTMPGVMLWRNQTGVFKTMDGRTVKVGNPGAPDALGVVMGQAIAVEFKTPTGRQSQAQKDWRLAFELAGGWYALVRSPDELVAFVQGIKEAVV